MKLAYIKKKQEAKGTWSFYFEPEQKIHYLPGQYFYLTLPQLKYPDSKGSTRHFTISISPTESKLLRITTRIRPQSGFKKTLAELTIGTIIEGEGPDGTYILDENEKGPHVFIAGGIGITPFRTFIKYNIDKNITTPMHLIYSNSIPEEIVFRKELEDWKNSHTFIKLDMTITKPEETKSSWSGLNGRIDETMIKSLVPNYKLHIFWVCGPPLMVDAMEKTLGKLELSSGQIRSEKFTGY